MRHSTSAFFAAGFGLSVFVLCQLSSIEPAVAQNITVQGVYVDAGGVLRYREQTPAGSKAFRRDRRLDPSICYVSLPKLFAEVRLKIEAGEEIPPRMRFLDGMVALRTIYVIPEEGDLLIAGPAEEIDLNDPRRPRGRRTGRPCLQLDDLVVALRSLGPGSRSRSFGCTLLQDAGAAGRVAKLQSRLGAVPAGRQSRVAVALKQAIGPLNAQFFGVPADTRFAMVAVEADYLMKRISLGLDRPPVAGLKSYLELSGGRGGSLFNRFWFTANYEPLLVSADGNSFEIRGQGLQILASDSPTKATTTNPAAEKFAREFTKRLPQLEEAVPGLADLHNLSNLAVLAALVAEDRLHEKAKWDLEWILNVDGYPMQETKTPRQAETLVNYSRKGRKTVTVAGGVQMAVGKVVGKRETAGAGKRVSAVRRVLTGGEWSLRIKPEDR